MTEIERTDALDRKRVAVLRAERGEVDRSHDRVGDRAVALDRAVITLGADLLTQRRERPSAIKSLGVDHQVDGLAAHSESIQARTSERERCLRVTDSPTCRCAQDDAIG